MKNEFILFSISLVLIVVIAVAGVAKVYQKTFEAIASQKQAKAKETLSEVLPLAVQFEVRQIPANADSYWVGKDSAGLVSGFAFLSVSHGYSSDIVCMTGIDKQGKVIQLRILSQRETPGLGTRVEEKSSQATLWNPGKNKSAEGSSWFQQQFSGLSALQNIGIRKEMEWHKMTDEQKKELVAQNAVSAMTGATVSTRAVIMAITGRAERILKDDSLQAAALLPDTSAHPQDSVDLHKGI